MTSIDGITGRWPSAVSAAVRFRKMRSFSAASLFAQGSTSSFVTEALLFSVTSQPSKSSVMVRFGSKTGCLSSILSSVMAGGFLAVDFCVTTSSMPNTSSGFAHPGESRTTAPTIPIPTSETRIVRLPKSKSAQPRAKGKCTPRERGVKREPLQPLLQPREQLQRLERRQAIDVELAQGLEHFALGFRPLGRWRE